MNMNQGRYFENEVKQSCHFCMRHSTLTSAVILQSIIKLFQMVTEIQDKERLLENKINRVVILAPAIRIDLFYNPVKYH